MNKEEKTKLKAKLANVVDGGPVRDEHGDVVGFKGVDYISLRSSDVLSLLVEIEELESKLKPVVWYNGCNRTIPSALRFLADYPRPYEGEARYNSAHLFQLADELESVVKSTETKDDQRTDVGDIPTLWDRSD